MEKLFLPTGSNFTITTNKEGTTIEYSKEGSKEPPKKEETKKDVVKDDRSAEMMVTVIVKNGTMDDGQLLKKLEEYGEIKFIEEIQIFDSVMNSCKQAYEVTFVDKSQLKELLKKGIEGLVLKWGKRKTL